MNFDLTRAGCAKKSVLLGMRSISLPFSTRDTVAPDTPALSAAHL